MIYAGELYQNAHECGGTPNVRVRRWVRYRTVIIVCVHITPVPRTPSAADPLGCVFRPVLQYSQSIGVRWTKIDFNQR